MQRARFSRLAAHLFTPRWAAQRAFPEGALEALEAKIAASETMHRGELRLVVEGALDGAPLWRNQSARARAVDLFAQLGVWDTAENSGVLLYVQLVDRKLEIVADRGIAARVPQAEWDAICREMESAFRARRFVEGVELALTRISALLATHFPAGEANPNELPDRPVLL